jgi:transcriptional regulator with XRE-family HTH domain
MRIMEARERVPLFAKCSTFCISSDSNRTGIALTLDFFGSRGTIALSVIRYHLESLLIMTQILVLIKVHVNLKNTYMTTVGFRLKQERQRLGMSQDDFSAVCGMKRRAQMSYEHDERSPDAEYLRSLAEIGVDIQFVVTGIASTSTLSKDENELLVTYRSLDVKGKARVLGVAEGISDPEPTSLKKTKSHVVFHSATIGQQISGDVTTPQTFSVHGEKKTKKPKKNLE